MLESDKYFGKKLAQHKEDWVSLEGNSFLSGWSQLASLKR